MRRGGGFRHSRSAPRGSASNEDGPPFEEVCLNCQQQLVVLVRYNLTMFELALDALRRISAHLGRAKLAFPKGELFSFLGDGEKGMAKIRGSSSTCASTATSAE